MRSTSVLPLVPALLALALFLGRGEGVAAAGTAVRMDVPQLVAHADLVLEARVLAEHALATPQGTVETELLLAVDRTFLGDEEPLRTVRVPGGVLPDGSGMLLAGMPHLRAGERAIVFLSAPGETGIRVPVGLAQGVFGILVTEAGEKVLVRGQAGLGLADPTTGRVTEANRLAVHAYAEVVAEIEAALAARRASEAEGR